MCSVLGTSGVPDNVRIIGLPTTGGQGGVQDAPHVDQQILTFGVSKASGEKGKLKAAINSLVGSPLVVTRDFMENEARAQATPHRGAALLRDLARVRPSPHTSTVLDAFIPLCYTEAFSEAEGGYALLCKVQILICNLIRSQL